MNDSAEIEQILTLINYFFLLCRDLVKEEYLVIILGYFFLFLHKTYVVGTH